MVREVQEHMLADQQQQWTNNKQKLWGCACQQGCTARCLNKQTNKSELNINHTMNHRSIFFKNNNFHPILWPQQQPFFEFSTYILTVWTVNKVPGHCTPNSLSERNKKKKTKAQKQGIGKTKQSCRPAIWRSIIFPCFFVICCLSIHR